MLAGFPAAVIASKIAAAGQSWTSIQAAAGCSRATSAKIAKAHQGGRIER